METTETVMVTDRGLVEAFGDEWKTQRPQATAALWANANVAGTSYAPGAATSIHIIPEGDMEVREYMMRVAAELSAMGYRVHYSTDEEVRIR